MMKYKIIVVLTIKLLILNMSHMHHVLTTRDSHCIEISTNINAVGTISPKTELNIQ